MERLDGMRRRSFLRGAAAAGAAGAPALGRGSANRTIGIAVIGVGLRGKYLLEWAQKVPDTEVRIICDLYQGNIAKALKLCRNPKVRVERAWEKAVADPDVDAVIIATPDFWHAPMTIAAAQAGKDIYVEKGWCIRLSEAKQMRAAVKENRVVMQLGHHYRGYPSFHKARELFQAGKLGKLPLVRIFYDQGLPYPTWKFYGSDFWNTRMPADARPENIDWERFIANAPRRPFSAERFFTWRCYWDYGTGLAGDCMSHQWDGVNMIVEMGIPETAVTHGATYCWEDDRDVPDQWHVVLDYPKRKLAVVFGSAVHNGRAGRFNQLLGREATLEVGDNHCRLYEADWKPGYAEKRAKAPGGVVPPEYEMAPGELKVTSHMEDFIECIRTRRLPRCHVDRAFEEAVAILMSVEAYRKQRMVRWDPAAEEIV